MDKVILYGTCISCILLFCTQTFEFARDFIKNPNGSRLMPPTKFGSIVYSLATLWAIIAIVLSFWVESSGWFVTDGRFTTVFTVIVVSVFAPLIALLLSAIFSLIIMLILGVVSFILKGFGIYILDSY